MEHVYTSGPAVSNVQLPECRDEWEGQLGTEGVETYPNLPLPLFLSLSFLSPRGEKVGICVTNRAYVSGQLQ